MMSAEAANEMHFVSAPDIRWSRVNAAESFTKLVKPLAWDFFGVGTNLTWRRIFENFGLIAPGQPMPGGGDAGYVERFFGRNACNMNAVIAAMSLFPGDHSGNHAREIFSEDVAVPDDEVPAGDHDAAQFTRYCDEVAGVVMREHVELLDYWRAHVGAAGLLPGFDPVEIFNEAFDRYVSAQTNHSANSTLCQQHFSRASELASEAGLSDLASSLTTGIGDTFDTRSMVSLWDVSRGRMTMEQYLADFGFQTSVGDDISAHSWREQPGAITALVENYRKMSDTAAPHESEHARIVQREDAERRIIAALPAASRDFARRHFDILVESTRVRELGKASYRIALDIARAAARARGVALREENHIADAEDIFYLTRAEAFDGPLSDLRERVLARKAIHDRYAGYDLPDAWTGNPEPLIHDGIDHEVTTVTGLGVSSGVAQGKVRLILDHSAAEEMEPGEILVTGTTDPSWGPFFVMAGALVIDMGGPMSHGAIIARELGIPCVINTRTGTRQLKDGMMVRVNGDTGEVTVMSPSSHHDEIV